MENANSFGLPVPPNVPRNQVAQELNELLEISVMIDSCLENIDHNQIMIPPPASPEQLLNDFLDPSDLLEIDDIVSDAESMDTPLVSPFLDSDDESNNDFIVFEDIGKYIESELSKVVMGKPFKDLTHLEDDYSKAVMSSSTVAYTSVYSDYEPWRFQWVSDAGLQSLEAAPHSPKQAPPSPNYPLPANASPTALSPGYVADSDPEEGPEEDPIDYPADRGYDEEEEASEEDEDADEEHLAPANSTAATPPLTPRSPRTNILFSQTRLHRERKTVRLQPHMAASTEALIAKFASAPTPPLPPPSPLSPWSSSLPHIPSPPLPLPSPPTHTSLTYVDAPLGY
uniref:Uncharacterized protein n=1 Tax=Tanacetum cinerariifolium TaxID=118510 RepID=A0A6L2JX39_TANCI|nr:hypothetical protein [Tanacetum cinerariifolium]